MLLCTESSSSSLSFLNDYNILFYGTRNCQAIKLQPQLSLDVVRVVVMAVAISVAV